jgi:heterodisulfide reductase subunit C
MTKEERIENLNRLSGTDVRKCMKCGKCSGRCPAFHEMDIKPHQFVSMLARGKIDELLESEAIWNCLSCMACFHWCPQKAIWMRTAEEDIRRRFQYRHPDVTLQDMLSMK